jgi:hypothetical protein
VSAEHAHRAVRRPLAFVLGMFAVANVSASAQRPDSSARLADSSDARLACASSGLTARAWTSLSDSAGAPRVAQPASSQRHGSLDTTIVLSIADRGWQRDNVDAGVALGGAGTAGSVNAPWHACAGATVHLGRVTAQLHNVAGSIHLRADLSALDSIGRTRSSTPPAGPPRR